MIQVTNRCCYCIFEMMNVGTTKIVFILSLKFFCIYFNSISSWKPYMTFKIKRKPNKSQTWWTSNHNASHGSAADISIKMGLVLQVTNEYLPTLLWQLIVTKVSFLGDFPSSFSRFFSSPFRISVPFCSCFNFFSRFVLMKSIR